MKTKGQFKYTYNGENKTKEEIDSMDLSNMDCTIENLTVSYTTVSSSFPAEKSLNKENTKNGLVYVYPKETIRTKTDELLEEVEKYQQEVNGGVLKGGEFPYDFIEDFTISQKDDVITNSRRVEKEMIDYYLKGKKESQSVEKAPVFTYCKQMKNAIEALALRSLYGHKKYEVGDDWENFSRVENGEFEYSNAAFRHALGIGEEDEKTHLIAEAWNSVAKLELFLRKDLHNSK